MNSVVYGFAASAVVAGIGSTSAASIIPPPESGWIELERPVTPDATRAFYPAALSGDGHTVVGREWHTEGEGETPVSRAAIWHKGQLAWLTEPTRSGTVPPHALAYAINRTGTVIAGLASLPNPPGRYLNGACVWYQGEPLHVMAESPGAITPILISDTDTTGTVLVGRALVNESHNAAFVLRSGQFEILEPLHPGGEATAVAVSHDGDVVVGFSTNEAGNQQAVRWVNGYPELIHNIPSWATASYATDVNQDGTVIVGRIMSQDLALHFRWENGTLEVLDGLEPIGEPSVPFARAVRTNADGSVVIGGFNDQAFYWTAERGMRPLRTAALESGISLPCCTELLNALDVSDDGNTVLVRGRGKDFVITLGNPVIPGDANGDGVVDLDDLNLILSSFGLQGSDGDLNDDGLINLDDLNILLQNFG